MQFSWQLAVTLGLLNFSYAHLMERGIKYTKKQIPKKQDILSLQNMNQNKTRREL